MLKKGHVERTMGYGRIAHIVWKIKEGLKKIIYFIVNIV